MLNLLGYDSLLKSQFSSSNAIDRARGCPAYNIFWLQDVTLVYLFSAKPAIACWSLSFNSLSTPQESLRHITHVSAFFVLCTTCEETQSTSLWNASAMHSNSIASPPTWHNDPCGWVSQPLSPHLAPRSFTFTCCCLNVSLLYSTHTTRSQFQPLWFVCVRLYWFFYNPNPHAVSLYSLSGCIRGYKKREM